MTAHEACDVLGVRIGASFEEIKAAYHERAKRYHPDLHGEGADNLERFKQVQAAYDTLCRRSGAGRSEQSRGQAEATAAEDLRDPVRIVRAFLKKHDIEILFDGSMRKRSTVSMAMTAADIEAALSSEYLDPVWLVDEILLNLLSQEIRIPKSDVDRALRRVMREDQRLRRNLIVRPLLAALSPTDRSRADEEWDRLARHLFTDDPGLAAAVLQHFIWQVKQKLLGRPVLYHLMPVVFSPEQGSGKTTFVQRFLAPLKELAIGPVLLSDVADKRSGDIYRFPALFIDDVEKIDPRLVPVLKSLLTSEGFRRRRLGTSMSTTIRQRTTLIGTANVEIDELVPDETGHRRFAMLTFRNGAVATGGDPQVWKAVDEADYDLLWRSVDAFGPCPIKPYLGDLPRHQRGGRRLSDLRSWLVALDLGCDAIRRITTKDGVKAGALWELFREETGCTMSITLFGTEMARLAADPGVPFDRRVRTMSGTFYPLTAKRSREEPG
jgi:DnaJ domain/Virulence-associated protein E